MARVHQTDEKKTKRKEANTTLSKRKRGERPEGGTRNAENWVNMKKSLTKEKKTKTAAGRGSEHHFDGCEEAERAGGGLPRP